MRVALLAPEFIPSQGGVGAYSFELAKGLSSLPGIEVHIITPFRGNRYSRRALETACGRDVAVHFVSTARDDFMYNLNFQLGIAARFSQLHSRFRFDLLHSANLVHMPDIFLRLSGLRLPSVTTVHSTLRSQTESSKTRVSGRKSRVERLTALFYPAIATLESLYLKRTQHLIAVSEYVTRFLKCPHAELRVIRNGVDVNRFSPERRLIQSPELGFVEGLRRQKIPIVLFCGRLMAQKGLGTLIESMGIVLRQRKAFFIFAGPGNPSIWDSQLQGLPSDSYKFLGYFEHERIHELYSCSDIFVLPSHAESMPLTLLEAMSCGLPVIASRVGGIPEIIRSPDEGIMIEPSNPPQLAMALLSLIKSPQRRREMGKHARARIVTGFSSTKMALQTKKFYEEILKK